MVTRKEIEAWEELSRAIIIKGLASLENAPGDPLGYLRHAAPRLVIPAAPPNLSGALPISADVEYFENLYAVK